MQGSTVQGDTVLSTTSQYAVRALTHLARSSRGQTVLGRDLARATGVPAHYLAKIMLALRNAGLVFSTRGTGGGYVLLRPADAIHLIDIVSLFEGPPAWPECLLRDKRKCADNDPCTAHRYWGKFRRDYVHFLERTTLEEISMSTAHPTQLTRSHPRRRAREKA